MIQSVVVRVFDYEEIVIEQLVIKETLFDIKFDSGTVRYRRRTCMS